MIRRFMQSLVFALTLAAVVVVQAQAPCGEQGQACCQNDPRCGPNLTCTILGTCECGGQNQPCCGTDPQCGSSLTCAGGTCQCGGKDQACCEKTSGGIQTEGQTQESR